MTAIGLGLGLASAYSSISGGYAANEDAQFNASIKHQQAGMIAQQQDILAIQDARALRFASGNIRSTAAAKGIEMSGSPMAILIDTQAQMDMDAAIGQYNLEVKKQYTMAEAGSLQRAGKRAIKSGYTSGITTMFMTAVSAYNPKFTPKTINTPKPSLLSGGGKSGYGSRGSAYLSSGIR